MMDVVALGELLIDFTHVSADADGYPTMAAHPGGAVANFLAAIAKFGGKCALMGKVGDDAFGKLLLDTLVKAGIETKGMVIDDSVFTTLALPTRGICVRQATIWISLLSTFTETPTRALRLSAISIATRASPLS